MDNGKAKFEISLRGLHFHGRHGVMEQETKVGNEFIADVSVTVPYTERILEDRLEDTISYADIYEIVAEEMKKPRKLLETVAAVIGKRLKEKWPQISDGKITICKSTPPIPGITGSSEVVLFF